MWRLENEHACLHTLVKKAQALPGWLTAACDYVVSNVNKLPSTRRQSHDECLSGEELLLHYWSFTDLGSHSVLGCLSLLWLV